MFEMAVWVYSPGYYYFPAGINGAFRLGAISAFARATIADLTLRTSAAARGCYAHAPLADLSRTAADAVVLADARATVPAATVVLARVAPRAVVDEAEVVSTRVVPVQFSARAFRGVARARRLIAGGLVLAGGAAGHALLLASAVVGDLPRTPLECPVTRVR